MTDSLYFTLTTRITGRTLQASLHCNMWQWHLTNFYTCFVITDGGAEIAKHTVICNNKVKIAKHTIVALQQTGLMFQEDGGMYDLLNLMQNVWLMH